MALGTPATAATSSTFTSGTSGTVTATASAGRIYVAVYWISGSARTVTISGGSLTWAEDKFVARTTVAGIAVWSANNPSGITSQTITATFSGTVNGGVMVCWQQTGVATSSPTDGSGSSATPANGGGTYSTGAGTTSNANDTIYAVVGCDNFGSQSSTPSNTVINELFDYHGTNDCHLVVNYVNVTSAGSYTGTGVWASGPIDEIDMLVAFKEAAAGTGATVNAVPALSVGSAPIAVIDSGGGASVAGAIALSAGSAPIATIASGVDVTAAVADSVGTAPPANQIVSMVINAPAVVSLGSAPAAVISAGGLGADVNAVPAVSAGSTPIPVLSNDSIHSAVPAASAGSAPIAALGSGANVSATPATSVGVAPRPQISPAPPGGSGSGKVAATFAEGV